MRDEVDGIVDAWARERTDLDLAPVAVFSRISRLARRLDLLRREAFSAHGIESWEFDVLAARNLVGRHPDPDDRRGVLVRLTAEGKDTVDGAFGALLAAEAELLADLPVRERERLASSLRRLLAPFA